MSSIKKFKYYIKQIHFYKNIVINELESWAFTFNPEMEKSYYEGTKEYEENVGGYDIVHSLAVRLKRNKCTKEDYENILFHIWQINYSETRIPIDYHFNGSSH